MVKAFKESRQVSRKGGEMRKEHTLFYFNKEVDQALRECDEARAEKMQAEWIAKDKLTKRIQSDNKQSVV